MGSIPGIDLYQITLAIPRLLGYYVIVSACKVTVAQLVFWNVIGYRFHVVTVTY